MENYHINRIYKKYPVLKDKNKKVILYAPTFRKGTSIKIEDFAKNIDFSKYTVIFKQHPIDFKTTVSSKLRSQEGLIADNSFDILDILLISDLVVTDYSAIVFEAALLNKPLYFWVYDLEHYQNFRGLNYNLEQFVPKCPWGIPLSTNPKEIVEMIDKEEYGFDSLKEFSRKFIDYQDGSCTDKIIKLLKL
jgi:CDP-ribitol ribitolphosphotransferase